MPLSASKAMTDQSLFRHGTTMVRRLRLAPGRLCHGIATRFAGLLWCSVATCSRLSTVIGARANTSRSRRRQVEWEEPTKRIHRAVNVGKKDYEQVTVFLLDHPDAVPQPSEDPRERNISRNIRNRFSF